MSQTKNVLSPNLRLGIVGHGFVGSAVSSAFQNVRTQVFLVDPTLNTTIVELAKFGPDVVFVSVPTPMGESGNIDDSIVLSVVQQLLATDCPLIALKSTVTPKVIEKLWDLPGAEHRMVYAPEFLTERNAREDLVTAPYHVFGGDETLVQRLIGYFEDFSSCNLAKAAIHTMTPIEASLVKYSINSFLAIKVTYFNELFDVAEKAGARYTKLAKAIGSDPRIGMSHTHVPGFDGLRGFGGACLPKDTAAIATYAKKKGATTELIDTARRVNNTYRADNELSERERINNVQYDS